MNTAHMTRRFGGRLILALGILAVCCNKSDKSKPAHSSAAGARDSTITETMVYRAFGNEPFWSLTIDSRGLRFTSPEDSAGVSFSAVEPVANGDTLRWSGKTDKGSIVVLIWRGTCSDGMSDKKWSRSSTVKLNDTSYMGCAEVSTRPARPPTP